MLLILSAISIVEAVVYLFRYRSAAQSSAVAAGIWAFAVCALRVAFTFFGVTAMLKDESLVVILLAYAVPAGIATTIVHSWTLPTASEIARRKP